MLLGFFKDSVEEFATGAELHHQVDLFIDQEELSSKELKKR